MEDTEAAPITEEQTRSLRAWGEAEPTDLVEYRTRSWKTPITLAAVAVAAIIGTVFWVQQTKPAEKPQVSAPKPPVTPARQLTPDDRYIALIQQRGMTVISRDMSINAAHAICDQHKQGITDPQLADELIKSTPGMTMKGAAVDVDTAREVYCP